MIEIKKNFPPAKKLLSIIGPSFILLGLGLGSGEVILWPNLVSTYGLGIIWASIIGITLQFFINMEVERYSLVRGESVFIGFFKRFKRISPIWFLFSTFVPWIWPGIIISSSYLLTNSIGLVQYKNIIAIFLLLLIGIIYTFGKSIYKVQEGVQKYLILLGVPFILLLVSIFLDIGHIKALFTGLIGHGESYLFFPKDISIAAFLAALAYSGAGGNLNLSQSYYVKEKGFGMGIFSKKLPGIFSKDKSYSMERYSFIESTDNKKNYLDWWNIINLEHLFIFLFTGVFTILALSLLAFITSYPNTDMSGINFLLKEASYISVNLFPIMGNLFLFVLSLMLFGTQFAVFGSTSRIMSENIFLLKNDGNSNNIPKYFLISLWTQILGGIAIILLGFSEPLTLVITGALLNAFTMAVYCILLIILNSTLTPKFVRINFPRKSILMFAFFIYSFLLIVTFFDKFKLF